MKTILTLLVIMVAASSAQAREIPQDSIVQYIVDVSDRIVAYHEICDSIRARYEIGSNERSVGTDLSLELYEVQDKLKYLQWFYTISKKYLSVEVFKGIDGLSIGVREHTIPIQLCAQRADDKELVALAKYIKRDLERVSDDLYGSSPRDCVQILYDEMKKSWNGNSK